METYTNKEVQEKTGLSRQRLSQLRNGYPKSVGEKQYYYEPLLKEGEDYFWSKGNCLYTDSAIKKINEG